MAGRGEALLTSGLKVWCLRTGSNRPEPLQDALNLPEEWSQPGAPGFGDFRADEGSVFPHVRPNELPRLVDPQAGQSEETNYKTRLRLGRAGAERLLAVLKPGSTSEIASGSV